MLKTTNYTKIKIGYLVLLSIVWSLYVYKRGIIIPSDTIGDYLPWADALVKYNFNIFELQNNINHRGPLIFYYIWLSIIAASKFILGENWSVGIVTLNLTAAIFVSILLFKGVWNTTGKATCVFFASLFLILCHDFYLWIPFVLSDILFNLVTFSAFYLVLTLHQGFSKPRKRITEIIVLVIIACLFRPAWPPLMIFIIFSLSILLLKLQESNLTERHCFILRFTLLAFLFGSIIIGIHSYIMLNPDKWPFIFFRDWIDFIALDYNKGIVVYGHTQTWHFPPRNILDCMFISIDKFFSFFYFDFKIYSLKHTLINYIFFTPVYGLSIFAIIQLFKKKEGPSPSNWWCIFLSVSFIFCFAFFHALMQIDYDFRYRVPCLLPLIFLATLGWNELVKNFVKNT